MTVEIREQELKSLYVKMREYEYKYGKTINDILLEIIYGCYKSDPDVALEGIEIYFKYILNSNIDADWFDEEDKRAEIILVKNENELETED